MIHTKVTDADLRAYLDVGHSQAYATRHFGVSEAAVHQRLKRLRQLTSRMVALEQAGAVVEEKLSATARLESPAGDRRRTGVGRRSGPPAGRRPRALADVILKLAGEVRQQLGLQLAISRTLVDLQLMREFQETVIEIIQAEAPDTARRLIARLKERRALRPSADLIPSLDPLERANGHLA
jgi:hypothetical protein